MEGPSWHKQAVCKGIGFSVFYGAKESTPMTGPEIARGKQVCGACPVRRECLEFGLTEGYGLWGGYTKPERARALFALGDVDTIMQAYDQGDLDLLVVLP